MRNSKHHAVSFHRSGTNKSLPPTSEVLRQRPVPTYVGKYIEKDKNQFKLIQETLCDCIPPM